MIEEHDRVILTRDVPEHGLMAGDLGTVVHIHPGADAYGVEFVTVDGETVAVLSLTKDQIRAVEPRDIRHARPMESRA